MSDSGNTPIPLVTEQSNNQNLRTRIAAALGDEMHGDRDLCDLCLLLADAVIAVLIPESDWKEDDE
jgi:hypothetical protein